MQSVRPEDRDLGASGEDCAEVLRLEVGEYCTVGIGAALRVNSTLAREAEADERT
jgi:hypothetical protein